MRAHESKAERDLKFDFACKLGSRANDLRSSILWLDVLRKRGCCDCIITHASGYSNSESSRHESRIFWAQTEYVTAQYLATELIPG
jgi:hypothetical protein